jgi:hypothetical protein
MAKATITFEDIGDGSIQVSVNYGPQFDSASHAHQHTVLVMAAVEELMEANGSSVEELNAPAVIQ